MVPLLSVPSLALAQEESVEAMLQHVNELLAANQDFSRTCGAVYQYWKVLELGGFSVIRLWCKDEPCVNRINLARRTVSRETAAEIRFYPNVEAAEELTAAGGAD